MLRAPPLAVKFISGEIGPNTSPVLPLQIEIPVNTVENTGACLYSPPLHANTLPSFDPVFA